MTIDNKIRRTRKIRRIRNRLKNSEICKATGKRIISQRILRDAILALERCNFNKNTNNTKTVRAYICPKCNGYHLTSREDYFG